MSGSGRFWVELALVCYLLGFGYSVYSLATNRFLTTRITFLAIGAGFLFTTIFLFDRGHAIGRCPITNRFEVLVFMTWSMVLIYLVIGSTYRLSLMGAFTAPVASALLVLAVSLSPEEETARKIKLDLFSASANHGAVGGKFSAAMVGLHAVHGRSRHGISDWSTH